LLLRFFLCVELLYKNKLYNMQIEETTHGVILIAIAIATFQDLLCVAPHPPQILIFIRMTRWMRIANK